MQRGQTQATQTEILLHLQEALRSAPPFLRPAMPRVRISQLEKRSQTGDLKGKVALVTGGRVKIDTALRSSCRRMPHNSYDALPNDAARRPAGEADFREERSA